MQQIGNTKKEKTNEHTKICFTLALDQKSCSPVSLPPMLYIP